MSRTWRFLLRWAARLSGLPALWFVAAHLAAEGTPDLSDSPPHVRLLFGCLTGALIGSVLLWWWELAGGVMNVAGIAAFYAVHIASVGHFPTGLAIAAMALPGLLAVASCSLGLMSRSH